MEQLLADVLVQYGPAAALVAFFIWRDYKREETQDKRYKEMELYQREVLMDMIQQNSAVIQANTAAVLRLESLPCAMKEKARQEAEDNLRKQLGGGPYAVPTSDAIPVTH